MAVTSLWKVENKIDRVIDYTTNKSKTKKENIIPLDNSIHSLRALLNYATNPSKTEKQFFITGINCNPESAYEEMTDTKRFFKNEDKILAYHGYQSFVEGEVTPEQAHEIGVKLADEMWGDRFEVVISTHLNTKCLHNHFVINSVSCKDGKKYYSNRTTTALLRHTSDEICKEYNLKVLKEKKCKKSGINFGNYYKKYEQNSNYHNTTKRDIDLAIRQAYSYKDFLNLMKKLDYEVIFRANKISVRGYGKSKNIRLERSFGEDYSIENIKRRILEETATRVPFIENYYEKNKFPFEKRHKRAKAKGFVALYYHYCYLLKIFPTKVPRQKLPASIRADVIRMEQLSKQAVFLSKNKINNEIQLDDYIAENNFKISELSNKRELLWKKRKETEDEQKKLQISEKIYKYSEEIKRLREEVRLCDEIRKRVPKIDENLEELDTQEQKELQKKEKTKQGRENG